MSKDKASTSDTATQLHTTSTEAHTSKELCAYIETASVHSLNIYHTHNTTQQPTICFQQQGSSAADNQLAKAAECSRASSVPTLAQNMYTAPDHHPRKPATDMDSADGCLSHACACGELAASGDANDISRYPRAEDVIRAGTTSSCTATLLVCESVTCATRLTDLAVSSAEAAGLRVAMCACRGVLYMNACTGRDTHTGRQGRDTVAGTQADKAGTQKQGV